MALEHCLTAGDLLDALEALQPSGPTPVVVRGKGPGVYGVKLEATVEYDSSLTGHRRETETLVIIAEG